MPFGTCPQCGKGPQIALFTCVSCGTVSCKWGSCGQSCPSCNGKKESR